MKYWPEVIIVAGACLLAYGVAGFGGAGDYSGGWSFSVTYGDRQIITLGVGMAVAGVLARLHRMGL